MHLFQWRHDGKMGLSSYIARLSFLFRIIRHHKPNPPVPQHVGPEVTIPQQMPQQAPQQQGQPPQRSQMLRNQPPQQHSPAPAQHHRQSSRQLPQPPDQFRHGEGVRMGLHQGVIGQPSATNQGVVARDRESVTAVGTSGVGAIRHGARSTRRIHIGGAGTDGAVTISSGQSSMPAISRAIGSTNDSVSA